MIANNRHNHTVTMYYLLLKRNLKMGVFSRADLCSPVFDKSLLTDPTDFGIPTPAASNNLINTARSKSYSKQERNDDAKTIDEI